MGMTLRWTLKNVTQGRRSLLAAAGGIGLSLLLVMLVDGMFAGESERIVAYPRNAGADVWVMQQGVSNMHMATSLVRGDLSTAIRRVPGVAGVTPILYVNAFVEAGNRSWFSYVVGLRGDDHAGGPWKMVAGRDRPDRGEVIIPDVVARKSGVSVGDGVTVLGRRLVVAGVSTGTYSMANSVTFVSYEDLSELLSTGGSASYLLVNAAAGESASVLAERIRATVPDVNAMPGGAFVANDRQMAMQMGIEIIRLMTWIGSLVAMLIVAFTAYATTVRRSTEFGMAKALGLPNRSLYAAVLVEAAVVSGLGWGMALVLAHGLRPIIQTLEPQVALSFPVGTALRLALATAAIAIAGGLVPARRLSRLDPAMVFRG